MQYPVTVVLNKAIGDIETYSNKLASEYGLSEDFLVLAMEGAVSRVKCKSNDIYADMIVEAFNTIEKLNDDLKKAKENNEDLQNTKEDNDG